MVEFGKLRDSRKARWLGRGLTVYLNEYGKGWVSWDGVKGGKQASKWVITNKGHKGLGSSKQNAQVLLENKEPILGLGLSSPRNFGAGESSFTGQKDLESSYLNGCSMPSSGKNELTATKEFECSRVSPITLEQHVMLSKGSSSLTVMVVAGKGGQHSLISIAQPPIALTSPVAVAQASHK